MRREFTPGPWTHYDDSASAVHRHQIAAFGKTIAHIYCTKGDETPDAANARLITAAPDLYDALVGVTRVVDAAGALNLSNGVQLGPTAWYIKMTDALTAAKAAIVKAAAPVQPVTEG